MTLATCNQSRSAGADSNWRLLGWIPTRNSRCPCCPCDSWTPTGRLHCSLQRHHDGRCVRGGHEVLVGEVQRGPLVAVHQVRVRTCTKQGLHACKVPHAWVWGKRGGGAGGGPCQQGASGAASLRGGIPEACEVATPARGRDSEAAKRRGLPWISSSHLP
jgi:hypothetical protein